MLPFEVWGFFVFAALGIGWLIGNYSSNRERAEFVMGLMDNLIESKMLRVARFQILPGVWASQIIPWNMSEKDLIQYTKELESGTTRVQNLLKQLESLKRKD